MEEIIIALLFVYPGALMDVFYDRYAKYSFKYDSANDNARLAKYFFFSAIVTILSVGFYLFVTGCEMESFTELFAELSHIDRAFLYLVISFFITVAVAYVRYNITKMESGEYRIEAFTGCKVTESADTWRELIFGPDLQGILNHSIVRIHGGEKSVAGFAACYPNDFEKGIALYQTAFVENQFELEKSWAPDERYIGEPHAVYVDTATGIIVEFYDGRSLYDYLTT